MHISCLFVAVTAQSKDNAAKQDDKKVWFKESYPFGMKFDVWYLLDSTFQIKNYKMKMVSMILSLFWYNEQWYRYWDEKKLFKPNILTWIPVVLIPWRSKDGKKQTK